VEATNDIFAELIASSASSSESEKEEEEEPKEAEKKPASKKKEAEKKPKESKKKQEEVEKKQEEVEEKPIKVTIINDKGQTKKTGLKETDKKFLRSTTGEILDFKTQESIGTWNTTESRIDFNEDYVESDEEEEEEEEEYEN
jgi:hypothetical protein